MRRALLLAPLAFACSATQPPVPDAGSDLVDPAPIDLSQWNALGLQPDSGTIELIAELAKAARGEAADLDGDGKREVSVLSLPDGSRVWLFGGGPHIETRIDKLPDGHLRYTYHYQNYATPRMVDEFFPDRRVSLWDDDLDRDFDRRLTQRTIDAGVVEVIEEVDGGSMFVERSRFVGLLSTDQQTRRDALFGCDGNDNFPEGFPTAVTPTVSFSDAPSVSCDATQRKKLGAAFSCVKDKLRGCMERSNPTLAHQIKAHLVTDAVMIGCGNPCGGKYASTAPKSSTSAARMNFAKSYIDAFDSTQLCSLMLHELAHVAEVGFSDDHDDGMDEVYACANYCGGCQHLGPYGPAPMYKHTAPSDNENCARCAETESQRRLCGTKTKKEMGACVTNYTLCHAGLAGNMQCESCGNIKTLDCLGSEIPPARFDCCVCPAAYPTNDKPCPTGVAETDTCNMPPPECK